MSDAAHTRLSLYRPGEMHVRTPLLAIIATILIAGALKLTAVVTMPLAFAFFVAIVIWPVDHWIKDRVPAPLGWLGHLVAMVLVLMALAVFVGGLGYVTQRLAREMPAVFDTLAQDVRRLPEDGRLGAVRDFLLSTFGSAGAEGQGGSGLAGFAVGAAQRGLRSLGMILSLVTLIFFFTLIMLTEGTVWREKLRGAWGEAQKSWLSFFEAAGERFRWYLLVRAGVGIATALLYGLWLWAFGLDLIPVWMILTFLLGFVPTLGSLISGLLPFVFALAMKDVGTAFVIGAGLVVIEQVMGNFVDPKLQGRELSLSPLIVLLSILVWGYLWGVGGTLIAVPMTVLLVIAFSHVQGLRPLALMLSGATRYEDLDRSVAPD